MFSRSIQRFALPAVAALALGACSSGDSTPATQTPSGDFDQVVVVGTVAPDFTGSDTQLVDMADNFSVSSGVTPRDQSDFTLDRFADRFYGIGRFNIDTVEAYDLADPTNQLFEYSTLDDPEEDTSNPQRLVFDSADKAYLMRRSKDTVWIVDPTAEREEDFKLGELDLSAYDDGDGSPEPIDGVIVDGRLFVLMERLVDNSPDEEGVDPFVAVFDVASDTEIDTMTGNGADGRIGIALEVRNPGHIRHHPEVGILVSALGDAFGSFAGRDGRFTGGIERINPQTFATDLLIDDGPEDGSDNPFGRIDEIAIVDAENAYFSGLQSFRDETLFHFNPSSGEVSGPVSDYENLDISALEIGPEGRLWVGIGDAGNPRIDLLDDAQQRVRTVGLADNPAAIRFAIPQ